MPSSETQKNSFIYLSYFYQGLNLSGLCCVCVYVCVYYYYYYFFSMLRCLQCLIESEDGFGNEWCAHGKQ